MLKFKKVNPSKLKPDYQTAIINLHINSDLDIAPCAGHGYITDFLRKQLSLDYRDRIAYIDIGYYHINDICNKHLITQKLSSPEIHIILSATYTDPIFGELTRYIKNDDNVSIVTVFTRSGKIKSKKLLRFSNISSRKYILESRYDFKRFTHNYTEKI